MSVSSRRTVGMAVALVMALVVARPVAADAELVSSDPPAGAEVAGPFDGPIILTFSQPLAGNSRAELKNAGGEVLAEGTIPDDDPTSLLIALASPLEPGAYVVEATSVAEDGHILRPVVEFTVLEPEPTPSPEPSASHSPSASSVPSPAPSAAPSPTPSGDGTPAAGAGEALLPILAAVAVLAGLGVMLIRGRRNRST